MKRLLIANRGEIARRVLKAGRERGFRVAVISTDDDRNSLVCREVDDVLVVPSFLDAVAIVAQAKEWGADLIHPGYGFLSENADFAKRVEDAGINFVGPTAQSMLQLGGKESSKKIAQKCGVPTLEAVLSHELLATPHQNWPKLLAERGVFAPYLVKASGGGGGKGMRVVERAEDLPVQVQRASEEALLGFKDATVFVERYLKDPRHIEIQVFGDGKGGGVHLGERECSLQRRHQKVIEEAPSSVVDAELRVLMGTAALKLVRENCYRGAGTVEFLLDSEKRFYFLEMNTRLQVEHPVTECIYGVDLVHAQLDLALGKWPVALGNPDGSDLRVPVGVSFEARILAEDPSLDFVPTPGPIHLYVQPKGKGVRVDSGVKTGSVVSSHFDSMIAKLVVWAPSRDEAVTNLANALAEYTIHGCSHNIAFLQRCVEHPEFRKGTYDTGWIQRNQVQLTSSSAHPLFDYLNLPSVKEELLNAAFSLRPSLDTSLWSQLFQDSCNLGSIGQDSPKNMYRVLKGSVLGQCFLRKRDSGSTEMLAEDIEIRVTKKDQISFQVSALGQTVTLTNPWLEPKETKALNEVDFELRAPMAGKVHRALVKKGDAVAEGQVVFVIESMKMQLEVRSRREGVIAEVFVTEGQSLTGPDVLAELSSQ